MQVNIDYVIAQNATSIGQPGVSMISKGTFIGTKNYLFYIPSVEEQHTVREITTTTNYFEEKSIESFIIEKLNEKSLSLREFELYMNDEFAKEVPSSFIINLYKDIEQLKVSASWLGSGIYTNETTRKVGWKPFVQKLGKNKKNIQLFYSNHIKTLKK